MPRPAKRIRKAVFPVAGLGTRFLPATKAMPKEMLTVVDRPVIQHVVDEARAAGIEHFIFVTGRNKGVIEDHFDKPVRARERRSPSAARQRSWRSWPTICPAPAQTSFTRQQEPLGLGHAVWCARDIVGDEPFALLLPDMLHHGGEAVPRRDDRGLQRARRQPHRGSPVPENETHQYGIVGVEGPHREGLGASRSMVEKPKQGTAPSNLHISGRYILQPEIFGILERGERGAGGEIQLTDAMLAMLTGGQAVPRRALRRHHLRLRHQDRLPACQYRLWAGAPDLAPALKAASEARLGGRSASDGGARPSALPRRCSCRSLDVV